MSEDIVQYRLFPPLPPEDLTLLALKYTSLLEKESKEHVWHYQSFNLRPVTDDPTPQLFGCTRHRGNVEDEWFLVWLLFELSKKERDLVISITDDDGQFLLIESAHYLPKWLKPETAENRVYIRNGALHVVPQPQTPGEVPLLPVTMPTLSEGVSLVRNDSINTEASQAIQDCVQKRLSKCPPPLHRAHVFLPLPIAHMFSINKQLAVSSAHALIERDRQDMKVAVKMDHFSPTLHPMIMTEICFPRLLYAMLLHETVSAGPSSGGIGQVFDLSLTSHTLGIKLSYGLEILVSRYGCASDSEGRGGGGGRNDKKWLEFLSSLKSNGYFGDEIEGSARYQELLKSAHEYYNENTNDAAESSVLDKGSQEARRILSEQTWSEETFRNRTLQPPDDESWLNVSEEELDQLLEERAGHNVKQSQNDEASCLGLDEVSFGMKSFIDHVSSFDGAEFPWSADHVRPVNVDGEGFLETLEKMLARACMSESFVACGFLPIIATIRPTPDKLETSGNNEDDNDDDDEDLLTDDDDEEEEEGEGEGGGSEGEDIAELMNEMDRELASTTLGQSFARVSGGDDDTEETKGSDDGGLQPVDIDYNLLHNLIDSYSEGLSQATPTSNVLKTLGIKLPNIKSSSE